MRGRGFMKRSAGKFTLNLMIEIVKKLCYNDSDRGKFEFLGQNLISKYFDF